MKIYLFRFLWLNVILIVLLAMQTSDAHMQALKPTAPDLTGENRVSVSAKGQIQEVAISGEIVVREDDAANAEVGGPSSSWWHTYASGSNVVGNGHALWTYVSPFTNYVRWKPPLDGCGNWEVYAFIPIIDTGRADSSNAQYAIHYRGGTSVVVVDQNSSQKGWRSLGIYPFSQNAGRNGEYVELADYTGESTNSRTILFDDMAWTYRGAAANCYTAQFVGQSYALTMQAGSVQDVGLELRNVGGAAWDANTFLAARNPTIDPNHQDDAHPLCDSATWVGGCNRIANAGETAPGQSKLFSFKLSAPSTPGTYRINFGMVQEGVTWFGAPLNGGIWFEVTVTNAPAALSCSSFSAVQASEVLQEDVQNSVLEPQVWAFADDFSSNTGWPTWSDATSEVQIQNGRFCFDVHKSGTLVWDIHNTVSADNFTMRVELMPQTTSAEEYAYGIALRVSDRGYGFALSNWGRYEIVNFPADGTPKFRDWTTHSAIRTAGINVVEVIANQDQLSFYVNGTLIETILDSNFSNGKIGFYAATMGGGTQALFLAHNLSLTTIDPDEPPTYTPTVTPTSVDVITRTPTPTPTSTKTPQPNPITVTPTASRTATATPTNTFTPSPTATKTATPPIVNPNEIIVDDGDAGFSSSSNWFVANPSQPGACSYRGDARWTYSTNSDTEDWAQWQPNLSQTGKYEVFVYISEILNRMNDTYSARYSIHHRLAESLVTNIRQQNNYCRWISLGKFDFDAGSNGHVRLLDTTGEVHNTTSVIADAVKFVRVGDVTSVPPVVVPPASYSKPVLLVHGWQGREKKGTTCATIPEHYKIADPQPTQAIKPLGDDLPGWFYDLKNVSGSGENSFDVWIAYLDSSSQNTPSLETNAGCLARQIEYIYKKTGKKITIIAHSMGGVVSRACLSRLNQDSNDSNDPNCRPYVEALYTLGSPHGGVNFADLSGWLSWWDGGEWNNTQTGAQELSFSNMETFNSRHPNQSEIKYVFIGGDSNLGKNWHDGLVDRESAIGRVFVDWVWKYNPKSWPTNSPPNRYWVRDNHTGGNNSYYSNRDGHPSDSYYCIISEMGVEWRNFSECHTVPDYIAAQGASSDTEPVQSLQSTRNITGLLTSEQTASQPIVIDDSGNAAFVLLASENKVSFSLIRPDGQVITPALALDASAQVGFTTLPESSEFPAQSSYVISNTMPGTWQVQVRYLSPQTDTVRYVAYALLDSDRQLIVGEPKTSYAIGSIAPFTATLRSPSGKSIEGAQLVAKVSRPDGLIDTLPFTDLGDGEYKMSYVVPKAPGYVVMSIDAVGKDDGVDFTRHIDKLWTINPKSATFTGNATDQPVDQNGDGLFDQLAVTVEIKVTEPATYTVIAQLLADGDMIDSSSSGLANLSVGTHQIQLFFDGHDIHDIGNEIALIVGNGQILDVTHGDIPVADSDILHTTPIYRTDQFASDEGSQSYLPLIAR